MISLMSTRVNRSSNLSLKGFSLHAFKPMINNQEMKKEMKLVSQQKPVQNQ